MMTYRLVTCLTAFTLLGACSAGGPYESDATQACWTHVRKAADVRQSEIDVLDTATAEQKDGWVVRGTITPDKGPKLQYYCQVSGALKITDSLVTAAN